MTQAALTQEETPGRAAAEQPPGPPPARPQERDRATPARPQVSRRANAVKVVMGLAIWAMPMLRPAGPGNTAPADLFLGLAILVTALWFASRSHVMRFPYMFPVGLSILAGALASTVAYSHAYVSVGGGLVSLIQDAFLLAWCIGIANVGRDPALLRSMGRAWAISATCWAALMIIGVFGHRLPVRSGPEERRAGRVHPRRPQPRGHLLHLLSAGAAGHAVPAASCDQMALLRVIVTAIVLTGSNGGALVLIIATVLGAIFRMARRRGRARDHHRGRARAGRPAHRPARAVQSIVARAQTSSQFLNDSIGRQAESSGSRSMILSQTEQLYLTLTPPRHRAGRNQGGLPAAPVLLRQDGPR